MIQVDAEALSAQGIRGERRSILCDGVEGESTCVNVRLDGEDEIGERRPCGVVVADGLFGGQGLVHKIERGKEDVVWARGCGRRRRRCGLGG